MATSSKLGKISQIAIWDLFRTPAIAYLVAQARRLFRPFFLRESDQVAGMVLHEEYSRKNVKQLLIRPLSRSAIPISLASAFSWPQTNSHSVLLVGPRYESDYFMLRGYGFSPKRITLLDQFSTSPKIQTGDAHTMPYPDESFDITILSWCMAYSSHPEQMLNESWRTLAKDGILICCSESYESYEQLRHKGLDGPDSPDLSSSAILNMLPENTQILAAFDSPADTESIRMVSCVAARKI